jgi:hypothetical protein
MDELIHKLIERLPLDYRVLYRQFMLRVIDLEALSIQADVVGFLGQFAGVLIMLSLVHSVVTYVGYIIQSTPLDRLQFCLHMEHYFIATTMLVIGLITVVSWDSTFPDRRDVMVLSPLPIAPRTILFAKVSASAAVLALAIVTLNVASGVVLTMLLGVQPGPAWGFFQSFPAWWFAIVAASVFLYCSVLTIQGLTALLLPRRMFLRLSAILQLAAFALFLGVYFVQPSLTDLGAMADPQNHWILASSPSYWFFALFNQLNGSSGSLPPQFGWVARRAWIGMAVAVCGAAFSLILCYLHTMKRTVEDPDLVPGAGGFRWMPSFGNSLQTAIALFSIRSVTRSRQHRVAFAFYLAFVFGIAFSMLRGELASRTTAPVSMDLLVPTFLMMFFAVAGLRNVFALPISLTANWVLRTTQLRRSEEYVAATRRTLFLLAVVPVWLLSAALSVSFRPLNQVGEHLVMLALLGCIFVEIGLIGFYKVPFTCSYLPGKANIQLTFWGFVIVLLALILPCLQLELRALHDSSKFIFMLCLLGAVLGGLWAINDHRAHSAVIYFEEIPDEVITTLGLSA